MCAPCFELPTNISTMVLCGLPSMLFKFPSFNHNFCKKKLNIDLIYSNLKFSVEHSWTLAQLWFAL